MHPTIRDIQKSQLKKVPEIRTGYTVRVHQKIKEGAKERVQQFEGLVIKIGHGEGVERTFTVRKIVEGIGVEKVFVLHSPNIEKIVVKKKATIRRAKLYYMRERFGKSARLRERHVTDDERAKEQEKMEALIQEAVKADEKRAKEEADATPDVETPTEEVKTEEVPTEDSESKVEEIPSEEVAEAPAEVTEEVVEETTATPEVIEEKAEEAPAEAVEESTDEGDKEEK